MSQLAFTAGSDAVTPNLPRNKKTTIRRAGSDAMPDW